MKTRAEHDLDGWARSQRRLWAYHRDNWDPPHPLLPYLGGDEYGRRTIVLRISPSRFLVFAYWTCTKMCCTEMREQTWRWEQEDERE